MTKEPAVCGMMDRELAALLLTGIPLSVPLGRLDVVVACDGTATISAPSERISRVFLLDDAVEAREAVQFAEVLAYQIHRGC